MVDLQRRALIAGAAATVAALRLGASALAAPAVRRAPLPADPFTLGVASGDPAADGFVLWTRLAPDPLNGGGMPPDPVAVTWEVASDPLFATVEASGSLNAVADLAHTAHVEVDGLLPDASYWYRFSVEGWVSPVGRAHTLAVGSPAALRFGFVSCQNYASGYYPALAGLATEECDLWLHLGDYIYENAGGGPTRSHGPDECFTLEQYRARYALYKTDPDLQAAHHAAPVVPVWDDHEVDNNYTVVDDARRTAGYRAWFEHLPVRLSAPDGPALPIFRHLAWGDLAAFHMIDVRQYRDPPPCGGGARRLPGAPRRGPHAARVGAAGVARGRAGDVRLDLGRDRAAGRCSAPCRSGASTTTISGTATRNSATGSGPCFGSGSTRWSSRATSTPPGSPRSTTTLGDVSTPRIGTELVGTSVSSRFDEALIDAAEALIKALPYVEYANARDRGYTVVDLTRDRMRATYKVVSTIDSPDATVSVAYVTEVVARSEDSDSAPPATPVAAPASFTG